MRGGARASPGVVALRRRRVVGGADAATSHAGAPLTVARDSDSRGKSTSHGGGESYVSATIASRSSSGKGGAAEPC